jgi:hypothetical protein
MKRLEVSCAVRHIYIYIYIYVVSRLRVKKKRRQSQEIQSQGLETSNIRGLFSLYQVAQSKVSNLQLMSETPELILLSNV